ncbi:MAG: selenium-dependent molybdenum cofactor biosynthesis protein YqeB [Candidatus Krumholzibacteriota bacterium]
MSPAGCIWIQGAGELASGVAVRLVRSGFRVVLAETDKPLAVRRRVSFSEAVYSGSISIEGISGELVDLADCGYATGRVSVIVDPLGSGLERLGAAAIVDARMTKLPPGPLPARGIPLIGLGPGFRCGRDADLIVETHREARLGEVISEGAAAPNTGVAGLVGGQTALRVLKAPAAGRFTPLFEIGDMVAEGMVLGHVSGIPVVSGLAGRIRGLVHPDAELSAGTKVGDVDPRGLKIDPDLISDKALAVGGGVLEGLLGLKILPAG